MTEKECSDVAVLEKTRSLLEERGWVQGRYGNFATGYCLLGALGAAHNHVCPTGTDRRGEISLAAHSAVSAAIKRTYKHPRYVDTPVWNDARGRTMEQVMSMLDSAIEIAKSRSKT